MRAGVAAIGFAAFTQLDEGSAFPTFMFGSVVLWVGLAPVFTLAFDMIVGVSPLSGRERLRGSRRRRPSSAGRSVLQSSGESGSSVIVG